MDRNVDLMKSKTNRDKMFRDYWHRVFFKAMGFCNKEIESKRIAVVNSWSEQSPGHVHLRGLADAVKAGVRLGGAMPFEINVLGPCSGLAETWTDLAYYDLPQREIILNSIETAIKVGACEGWVGLCTCDKIVPAMIMAAIRINKPCIIVTGGPMLPGYYKNDWVAVGKGASIIYDKALSNSLDFNSLDEVTYAAGNACGSCAELTTGNSMQIITEALGLALPGSSMIPGAIALKTISAKEAGLQIMNLVEKDLKPKDIVTEASMKNAMAVEMAVAGGTNSIVHMQAIAYEGNFDITMDTWSEVSRKIPTLCSIAPSGPHSLIDFYEAGGVPALMNEIKDFLNIDSLTVSGKNTGENISNYMKPNDEVIRSVENPIYHEGSIAILKGNLAPRGAVIRHTIVKDKALLKKSYNAKVFNSFEDALDSIYTGKEKKVETGDIVVCRYEGPRGGPAMAEILIVVQALSAMQMKGVGGINRWEIFRPYI